MDLSKIDAELLFDKSGSMSTNDCPGGKSRWDYGQESALSLARSAEKHDADGISVVPFAGKWKVHEGVTAAKVEQVFKEHSPSGSTNTAAVLEDRLNAHFARRAAGSTKSTCLFVLTDGAPDDQQAVADTIIAATKKMEADEELAINFIQIGEDPEAAKFLTWLDDGLQAKGAKFDIVDTNKLVDLEDFTYETLVEKTFAD